MNIADQVERRTETRTCESCGAILPLVNENFEKLRYGFRRKCRPCFYASNNIRKMQDPVSRAKHLARCHAYDVARGKHREPLPEWVIEALREGLREATEQK